MSLELKINAILKREGHSAILWTVNKHELGIKYTSVKTKTWFLILFIESDWCLQSYVHDWVLAAEKKPIPSWSKWVF